MRYRKCNYSLASFHWYAFHLFPCSCIVFYHIFPYRHLLMKQPLPYILFIWIFLQVLFYPRIYSYFSPPIFSAALLTLIIRIPLIELSILSLISNLLPHLRLYNFFSTSKFLQIRMRFQCKVSSTS